MTNSKLLIIIIIMTSLVMLSVKYYREGRQDDRVETDPVQGHVIHSLHEEDAQIMVLGSSGDE